MKNKSLADELNENMHKEQAIFYKSAAKQMIRAFINKCPRDILIEVLVSKKIIKRDWMKKGVKYKLRK
jgi:hypothetical protein